VRVYAGATNTVLNTLTAAGNATSLNVTGLTNGSTYSFDVAATNAVGIGLASARSTIVTPAAVPSAPTIGTVTAGSASATITWTAPASNGSAITGYTIRVYDGATTTVLNALSASAGTTSLNVTGLTNGAAYSFDVAATNAVGTGPASARSNVVTPASPSAVPTIGIATPGNASATVTWTPPTTSGSPITGYKIRVFVGASTTVLKALGASATATSLTVTGLTNGTSYTFDVAAITTAGTGAASARSAPVTPATAPGTPPIDTAVSGAAGGAITATAAWIPPSSTGGSPVTGYQVTALLMATTGEVLAQTVSPIQPATARSLEMTLPVAGNYRFTVQAINAMGAGAQSTRSNLVAGR